MTAFAEVGQPIKSLDEITNDKCFTIKVADQNPDYLGRYRGTWLYSADDASHLWSTTIKNVTVSNDDDNQKFAFIQSPSDPSKYFIYSVGGKRFLAYDSTPDGTGGTSVALVDQIVNEASVATFLNSTHSDKANYPWVVALGDKNGGSHQIGLSAGYYYGVITSYNDLGDGGNSLTLIDAGTFDPTDAEAKIEKFEKAYTEENIANAEALNTEVSGFLSVPQYAVGGYNPQLWQKLYEACGGDGVVDIYDYANHATDIKNCITALKESSPTEFSNEKVYKLVNIVSSNGYLYSKQEDASHVYSSAKGGNLTTVPNSDKWQLYTQDGRSFLYNQGTKRFAKYDSGSNTWVLSDDPTYLTVTENTNKRIAAFSIKDTETFSGIPYMHCSTGYTQGVVGWNADSDASYFYFEEVEGTAVDLSTYYASKLKCDEANSYLKVPANSVGGYSKDLLDALNMACGDDGVANIADLENEGFDAALSELKNATPIALSNSKVYQLQHCLDGYGYLCFENENNENSNYVFSSTKIANQKLTQLDNSDNWQIYTFGDNKAFLYNQGKKLFVKYDKDKNKWVATEEPVYISIEEYSPGVFAIKDLETAGNNPYININNGDNSYVTGVVGWNFTDNSSHFYIIEVPDAEVTNLEELAQDALDKAKKDIKIVLDSYDESKANYVGSYLEESITALNKAYNDPSATVSSLEEALTNAKRKQVEAGKYYTILNTMQFTDGGVKAIYANPDGTNVAWHTTEGTAAELWQFVQENGGDGDYYIKNVNSGKSIVLTPGANSGNLQETSNTPFRFSEQGDDFITFGLQAWNNQNSDKATLALQTEASWGKIPDAETESGDFIGTNNNINATTPSTWNIVEVTSVNLTIGSTGYATAYFPFAVTIPDGVNAYTVSAAAVGKATLSPLTGTIPANTGVILSGDAKTYPFAITTSTGSKVEGNMLDGVTMATDLNPETSYILANGTNGLGFYKVDPNDKTLAANKAYLVVSNAADASYSLKLDGAVTGIQSVENAAENAPAYDLQGRRLPQVPTKGLYIQNGKKIMK